LFEAPERACHCSGAFTRSVKCVCPSPKLDSFAFSTTSLVFLPTKIFEVKFRSWRRGLVKNGRVNYGWADYRDNHLGPELREMKDVKYALSDIKVNTSGHLAWATFK
jgi:hypothetical protein